MERTRARARWTVLATFPLLAPLACSPALEPSSALEDPEAAGDLGHEVQALTGPAAWWVTEYNDMSSSEDDGKCQAAYTNCGPASIAMVRNKVTNNSPKHGAGWMRQKMFDYKWDTGDCLTGTTAAERTGLLKERLANGNWIDNTPYYTVINRCKSTTTYTATDLKNDMASGAVAAAEASGRYTGAGGQMGPCGWNSSSGHSIAVLGWNGTTFTVVDPDSHKKEDGTFSRCGSSKTWTTDKNGTKVQTASYKAEWTPTQLTRWSNRFGSAGGLCVTTVAGPTCTGETNTAFCTRLGKNCGSVTATDNCGKSRTVTCGTCTAPETCSTSNVCRCPSETNAALCARLGGCGMVSGTDLCGLARSLDCGICGIASRGSLSIGATAPLSCAEVAEGSELDGAGIVLSPCQDVDPQHWTLTDLGQLQSASSAKCAQVQGSAPASLVQAACADSASAVQAWGFPSVQVVSSTSLHCVEQSGDTLTIQPCQDANVKQRFTYRPDTRQLGGGSGLCVDATGAASGSVRLAACDASAPGQRWLSARGGFVSGADRLRCLRVAGDTLTVAGSLVETAACDDSEAQRWALRGELRDSSFAQCLTRPALDAPLTLAECDGSALQVWTLWSPASDPPLPEEPDAGLEADASLGGTDASGASGDASLDPSSVANLHCGCSAGGDRSGLALLLGGLLFFGLRAARAGFSHPATAALAPGRPRPGPSRGASG